MKQLTTLALICVVLTSPLLAKKCTVEVRNLSRYRIVVSTGEFRDVNATSNPRITLEPKYETVHLPGTWERSDSSYASASFEIEYKIIYFEFLFYGPDGTVEGKLIYDALFHYREAKNIFV